VHRLGIKDMVSRGNKRTAGRVQRRPDRPVTAVSWGNLATHQDIINARRQLFRMTAAGEIDYRLGHTLSGQLSSLRKDMEAMQRAEFGDRIAAYEAELAAMKTGQMAVDRPGDATLQ
jgi:hypothetical protein